MQLVLYYDGFFSPALETTIKAALPTTGTASRGFSMRAGAPDELFYLKNQGERRVSFSAGDVPAQPGTCKRSDVTLKVPARRRPLGGLRSGSAAEPTRPALRVDDRRGRRDQRPTAGQPLRALRNQPLLDRGRSGITAADNPGLVDRRRARPERGFADLLPFLEYGFDYRVGARPMSRPDARTAQPPPVRHRERAGLGEAFSINLDTGQGVYPVYGCPCPTARRARRPS